MIESDLEAAVALAVSAASRGDRSADNIILNDESRWKSGTSTTRRRVVDRKNTRRAYVLRNVSRSFPGTTAMLSISGSANKLTAQVIFPNKNKVAVSTPTRESSRVPPEVALPDLLLSVAHSPKGWNYHVLYKEEYRKDVLRPYQSAVFEDRFRRGEVIIAQAVSPSVEPQPRQMIFSQIEC